MKAIAQHFIGTTQEWESANPKLYKAVWGFEITADGRRYAKLGDGERKWNDLPYFDENNLPGLAEKINDLTADDQQLQNNIKQAEQRITDVVLKRLNNAEQRLQHNIDTRETYHDATMKGRGTPDDPLSVHIDYGLSAAGLTAKANLEPDGATKTFPLPADFVFLRIVIVQINGMGQKAGADYALDLDARTITFTETPESGDSISLYYTTNE